MSHIQRIGTTPMGGTLYETSFEHDGSTIYLEYEIERVWGVRVLTLLDITAATQEAVDAVPDHIIEYYAMATAEDHDATY